MKGLNGWKQIKEDILPNQIFEEIKKMNGFKYGGLWYEDMAFSKNENDFIVMTDDGGFYKVHAKYMVWYKIGEHTGSQALWSLAALKRTLKSLMLEGQTTFDPNYQT